MRYIISLVIIFAVYGFIDTKAKQDAMIDHPVEKEWNYRLVPNEEVSGYTRDQVDSLDDLVGRSQTRVEQRAQRKNMTESEKVAAVLELWGRE